MLGGNSTVKVGTVDYAVIGFDESDPVERSGITDEGGFCYVERAFIDEHPQWYEPIGVIHLNNERVSIFRVKGKGPS